MTEVGKGVLQKLADAVASPAPRFDWDDLRLFTAIADTGSLSAAARLLGTTPGSLSKRIDDLEYRLQARLLIRDTTGARLTEAGEMVYDHALTMQRSAAAIERLVQSKDKRQEGRVTLAAPDGVAAFWVAPRLGEFLRANPKIHVGLDCGFWANDPLRDPPELAIVAEKDERKLDQIYVPIGALHYALFASPSYLETYGVPQSLASVADHRWLHHTALTRQRENWHEKAGALQTLADPSIETNSSVAFVMAMKYGAGIGVIPTAILTVEPDLVMVGEQPMSKIQLWLAYHRDAMKIARLRAVADWIKSIFEPRANPWFRDEFVHPRDIPGWRADPANAK